MQIDISKIIIFGWLIVVGITANCHASSVRVYGEGGYTDNAFLLKIYADIDADSQGALISAGVKIIYPADKLTQPFTVKNEGDWYFGSAGAPFSYLEPTTGNQGEIKIILGKLNATPPLTGAEGKRILLARIDFARITGTEVPQPHEFTITCGSDAPFADFVTIQGSQLDDSVVFEPVAVVTQNTLLLRDTMRILRVTGGLNSDVPMRPTEFDVNSDGKVDVLEAFDMIRATDN